MGGSQEVWVTDWEAVLRLLDRWPWARLYPLHVHPDFSHVILHDAQALAGEDFAEERWTAAVAAQVR